MNYNKKIVSQLPLATLWTNKEIINAQRKRYLTIEDIKEILKINTVDFVIADIGEKLNWFDASDLFDFWKNELKSHLVRDIKNIQIENFPDNYAYVVSEWMEDNGIIFILIEKYH